MLTYAQVTGRFLAAIPDSTNDVDTNPDLVPLFGSVTFTPSPNSLLANVSSTPVTIVPKPITVFLDSNGDLSYDGTAGVTLIATDGDTNPTGFTYKVSFNLMLEGNKIPYESFNIAAPGGVTTDLSVVAPVASSGGVFITRGEAGVSVSSIDLVGTDYVYTMTDNTKHVVPAPPNAFSHEEHELRVSELRRRTGDVKVSAQTAITIVMDHGLNKFNTSIYPLLEARGIPVTLALNSDWQNPNDSRYSTNNEVTPTMVKTWIGAGIVEPANHGRTHTGYATDAENTTEIEGGRRELETMLGVPVDTWVQPAMGSLTGFDDGNAPEKYWETHTGREILRTHAVVSGLIPGSSFYPLDGEPVVGMKGGWIDTDTAPIETNIGTAISTRTGYIVRFHPQYLDTTGYITTAQLTAFLDKLVAWRDNKQIEILPLRKFAVAEKTEDPSGTSGDTGWRAMPAFTGARADATRPGVWRLRRIGNRVTMQMVGVGVAGTGENFIGPNAIPAGFTMSAENGLMYESPTAHSTGVLSVYGPTHRILVAGNDVVWRGWLSTTFVYSNAAPAGESSMLHAEVSWTTNDAWPSTLPGTAA